MLPKIERLASLAFRGESKDVREEMIQEVICNALVAFKRLYEKGRVDLAYPSVLALYGIRQVRDGRKVGSKLNVNDVMSSYAQQRKDVKVDRLDRFLKYEGEWVEAVVEDWRTPVPDQVAFRIDFPAWLARCSDRERKIVETLLLGYTTNETAKRFGISPSRPVGSSAPCGIEVGPGNDGVVPCLSPGRAGKLCRRLSCWNFRPYSNWACGNAKGYANTLMPVCRHSSKQRPTWGLAPSRGRQRSKGRTPLRSPAECCKSGWNTLLGTVRS